MRVERFDQRLAAQPWPPLEPVETLGFGPDDVVLVSAGFEDRALEILRRAVTGGATGFECMCIEYLPRLDENRLAEIGAMCAAANARCDVVTFDRENPAGAANEVLRRVRPESVLHIDISGMSRLLIVQLLSEGLRRRALRSTEILYVEAMDYPPTEAEVDAKLADSADPLGLAMFLSAGVFGLTVVPELSSVAMQGQPIHVAAFPSWNTTQMAAICSEIQASYYTLIHGVPPLAENAWRPGKIAALNRVDSLSPRDEVEVSTLDYRETLRALLKVYSEHIQREKLVVAPTGSKMQAVAVGLLCGWLRDVQVAYPTPRVFSAPQEYTRGVRRVFSLSLAEFNPPEQPAWDETEVKEGAG